MPRPEQARKNNVMTMPRPELARKNKDAKCGTSSLVRPAACKHQRTHLEEQQYDNTKGGKTTLRQDRNGRNSITIPKWTEWREQSYDKAQVKRTALWQGQSEENSSVRWPEWREQPYDKTRVKRTAVRQDPSEENSSTTRPEWREQLCFKTRLSGNHFYKTEISGTALQDRMKWHL